MCPCPFAVNRRPLCPNWDEPRLDQVVANHPNLGFFSLPPNSSHFFSSQKHLSGCTLPSFYCQDARLGKVHSEEYVIDVVLYWHVTSRSVLRRIPEFEGGSREQHPHQNEGPVMYNPTKFCWVWGFFVLLNLWHWYPSFGNAIASVS